MGIRTFTSEWRYGEILLPEHVPFINCRKIVSIGSCFARNLTRWLKHYGVVAQESVWDIFYNPFSILKEFQRLYSNVDWEKWTLEETNKAGDTTRYRDAWRTWQAFLSMNELTSFNRDLDGRARKFVEQADAFLVTFGLVEIWSPISDTSVVLNHVPIGSMRLNRQAWASRIADVFETTRTIESLVEVIQSCVGKDRPIIFTLSPVPLKCTASELPIREANSLSKATLLVAIRKVCMEKSGVYYYPSYEMVQALTERGWHVFQDDGRHVTATVVDFIARKFVELYGDLKDTKDTVSKFWVPLVNRTGEVVGRSYVNGTIENGYL